MTEPRRKLPSWLRGVVVGSFSYALTNEPEFLHYPLEQRKDAAHFAQGRALGHWQVWCAIAVCLVSVIGVGFVEIWLGIGDKSGAAGACVGFFLGAAILQRSIYYQGLPYYRAALLSSEKTTA